MFYCGACAAQAATQGFTINKIMRKILPYYPNYAANSRYH